MLTCTGCRLRLDLASRAQRCPECDEPLEVEFLPAPGAAVQPGRGVLTRFGEFLPAALGTGVHPPVTLGEGDTPLLPLPAAGRPLGLSRLYAKVEGANPTGSFKDRGTAVGVQRALALGLRTVATVSTGNMAGSVAAYAARAGLQACVLVPADIPPAKLGPVLPYGPTLLGVDGPYGSLYRRTVAIGARTGLYFINSDDPWRIEGQKTTALEIWHAFGGRGPDVVVVPTSSGGHLAAIAKGFRELVATGRLPHAPRLVGVQAAGCAPIAGAFRQRRARPLPWSAPGTLAGSIANPDPPSGARLLRAALAGDGGMLFATVSDDEILAAYRSLAREEGIFCQPDSAAALAALAGLVETGQVGRDEQVVLVLTGHGTKDMRPLGADVPAIRKLPLDALETALAGIL